MKNRYLVLLTIAVAVCCLFHPCIVSASETVQTDSDGSAQVTTIESNLVPLSNENFSSIIRNAGYKDWWLYQPAARESERSTSNDYDLSIISAYPIVAVQDTAIHLLVLKKQDDEWYVAFVNKTALSQENFQLTSFSLDESYSQTEDMQNVYFEFESNGETVDLTLMLSNLYPSYFSSIHYQNTTIIMHYDRGISYEISYPSLFSCSYKINPESYIDFRADAFSLQQFLQTMQELLVPATITAEKEAGLYMMPDDTANPIITLKSGESIQMIKQENSTDWEMVYYNGNILFVHGTDVSIQVD